MASPPIRILLVEDNPGDARLIRKLLAPAEGMTFDLVWVRSLGKAIDRVAADGKGLILLDLALPDSRGLNTLRQMCAASPDPIIVLTRLADEETAIRAVQDGAQDYLIKGQVDSKALMRYVRYALGKSQIHEALRRAKGELEDHVRERTAELVRANQALHESQHLLESLLDNLTTVVFAKDLSGHYILVNTAFERLFSLRRESIIGKTDYDLFPPELARSFQEADRQAVETRSSVEVEERVPGAEGLRTFLTIKAPLFDLSGEPHAAIGIAADITERKHLEEQLRRSQKMEAVGRLAGGIAHDFNNLLSVIVGYSELLRDALADRPTELEQLTRIGRAAEHAATLTRKLLAFSRRQMIQQKPLDLNTALQDLKPMIRSVVGENIEVDLQAGDDPCVILAERDQIEQAVLNLVLNARDAMPAGGRLSLSAARVDVREEMARMNRPLKPGPHVRLTIADTGCGMDAETRSHIFEPFFTTKDQGKGTGLGLAMVYGTVQQAGGAIVVESERGKGTSFHIYLPWSEEKITEKPATVHPGPERGHETILVAEDEDAIRNLLSEVLRMYGYTVLAAKHGRDALDLAGGHEGPIHLLISDLVMPQMGGRELAHAMALLRPETQILFISGYSERTTEPLPEGLEFMDKPFTPEKLARKVRQMLDAPEVQYRTA